MESLGFQQFSGAVKFCKSLFKLNFNVGDCSCEGVCRGYVEIFGEKNGPAKRSNPSIRFCIELCNTLHRVIKKFDPKRLFFVRRVNLDDISANTECSPA